MPHPAGNPALNMQHWITKSADPFCEQIEEAAAAAAASPSAAPVSAPAAVVSTGAAAQEQQEQQQRPGLAKQQPADTTEYFI